MQITTECISVFIDHRNRLRITETTVINGKRETRKYKGHEYLKHKQYK